MKTAGACPPSLLLHHMESCAPTTWSCRMWGSLYPEVERSLRGVSFALSPQCPPCSAGSGSWRTPGLAEATHGTSRWLCSSRWRGTSCCGLSAWSPPGRNRESPEKAEGWGEPRRYPRCTYRETDMALDSLFPRKLGSISTETKICKC